METQLPQFNYPEEPKRSWFSLHHALGYTFLLAFFAAVVSLVYYWQTEDMIPDQYETVIHQSQEPTNNWKTYTNTEYGFEFKYPGDFNITYDEKDAGFKLQNDSGQINFLIVNESFEDSKNNINDLSDMFTIIQPATEISLAGKKSIASKTMLGNCRDYLIYAPLTESKTIHIDFNACTNNNLTEKKSLIDQILSTFKFIETRN